MHFYIFYLFKLIHISDKENVGQMSLEECKLCWFIGQVLPKVEFDFRNNVMPYDLQRYVQEFFEKKLNIIYTKVIINLNQNKETSFEYGLKFILGLEKVFQITHLTYGKFIFI